MAQKIAIFMGGLMAKYYEKRVRIGVFYLNVGVVDLFVRAQPDGVGATYPIASIDILSSKKSHGYSFYNTNYGHNNRVCKINNKPSIKRAFLLVPLILHCFHISLSLF